METALELRGIAKRFGPIVANDGVDFDLRRGGVLAHAQILGGGARPAPREPTGITASGS